MKDFIFKIKTFKKIFVFIFILGFSYQNTKSQQINSLYFLENLPVRNNLNPAFSSSDDFYLGLPVIGMTQFDIGNNSLTLKNLIFSQNGQTVTFLNNAAGINQFYNMLNSNTVIRGDLQTNILSFGFRNDIGNWNFSVNERLEGMLGIPKDLIKLLLFGTPNFLQNSYNLTTLQTDFTLYTEVAAGFSKQISDRTKIGGKIKFLIGSANLSNVNSNFNLNAGLEKWTLNGQGSINESSPVKVDFPQFRSFTTNFPGTLSDWLTPSGYGAGIDAGIEYRLTNRIKLSFAILDLGFISWNRNLRNVNYATDYQFNGLGQFSSSMSINTLQDIYTNFIAGNRLVDSLKNSFNQSVSINQTSISYITGTSAKLNAGIEYNFLTKKISVGLLSHSQLFKKTITEELTLSLNYKPVEWFNSSVNYSFFNGNLSSFGAAFSVRTGIFNWFAGADYIPFEKLNIPVSGTNIPFPYNTKMFNLTAGMILVFNKKDKPEKEKEAIIPNEIFGLNAHSKNIAPKPDVINTGSTLYKKKPKQRNEKKSSGLHKPVDLNECRCNTY
jgi:hypothetical protein